MDPSIIQEIKIPSEVPVMTLSSTVLFPQAMMPLYIFEPRYREMLDEVLKNNKTILLVAIYLDLLQHLVSAKKEKKS